MDTVDLSHKLAYAGARSPVPFTTGPEYTNSVPGVPVLSELRIFISPEHWSEENVLRVSREISRILGPTAQFDIGMTFQGTPSYDARHRAAGNIARLMKLDPDNADIRLLIRGENVDRSFTARFPRLGFEPGGEDFWRTIYTTGAVKLPNQE